jgi:hypothetical protein
MSNPTSTSPLSIPGLGLPADPVTGLPYGAFNKAEFSRWALCMAGWILLTAGTWFGMHTCYMSDATTDPTAQAPAAPTARP